MNEINCTCPCHDDPAAMCGFAPCCPLGGTLRETAVKVKHPMQPLVKGKDGIIRFKANAIVCHLLDHGGIDLNKIAQMNFSDEDREQFAQLIGYSVSGFGELQYVSDETYDQALQAADRLTKPVP